MPDAGRVAPLTVGWLGNEGLACTSGCESRWLSDSSVLVHVLVLENAAQKQELGCRMLPGNRNGDRHFTLTETPENTIFN